MTDPAPAPPALPRGLLVAAPASGHGKTTVTLGLAGAFARRGLRVQPFKIGPDYIDPAFLTAAAGRPCHNLDPWAMRPASLTAGLATAADADLALVEGVTGLFDGAADGTGGAGELALVAERLQVQQGQLCRRVGFPPQQHVGAGNVVLVAEGDQGGDPDAQPG